MARDLRQNFCVFLFQNTINKQSVDIVIEWADLINCILVNNKWNLHNWLADDIQSCTFSCSRALYCYLNLNERQLKQLFFSSL